MARGRQPSERVEVELAELETLSRRALLERWQAQYGSPCPARMSQGLIRRALAYRIQEQAFGGLDRATQRRLDRAAADLAAGRSLAAPGPQIKPGTRLLREWNGKVHEVIVLENSVQYRDQAWPSLSAVAREITGARWSGPRFFGLLKGTPP